MKLIDVLNEMNSFEKNSFLKILDNIIANEPKEQKEIDRILSSSDRGLKDTDLKNIVKIFILLEDEFSEHIENSLGNMESQIDFVSNILVRDGNTIMKYDWLSKLYEQEVKSHKKNITNLQNQMDENSSELDEGRKRDYKIYKACVHSAYENDLLNNQDPKITTDEQHILMTLANQLSLSQNELQLINYMVLPLKKREIDDIKSNTIYIPNEVVVLLRRIKGREVADKHLRRVLKLLKDPQINLACKIHNIPIKGIPTDEKVKTLIEYGISFRQLLSSDIYKSNTSLTARKATINEIAEQGLKFDKSPKGSTVDDKIDTLVNYFEEINSADTIGISVGGYEHLLVDLEEVFKAKISKLLKTVFQLQEEDVLNASMLLDYNIRPRDLLELLDDEMLKMFCSEKAIKTRGNQVLNILDTYKNTDYLEIENYTNIGMRDLNTLKSNGVVIKEADLGIKFEDITKQIFIQLGLNVDEKMRKDISTNKDKIDIVINLGNNEIIIIECKSVKDSGYNKFSSVSRQIKSYVTVAEKQGYNVVKSILVSPEFTDEFVKESELDFDLNLSLLQAESLKNILESFKNSKLDVFPYKLFRDVVIREDRIIMAISK
jgi:RecB family endonuclease NucS